MADFQDALDHAKEAIGKQTKEAWGAFTKEKDGVTLYFFARRLRSQVLHLNAELDEPEDLCPECAGDTWGRPPPENQEGLEGHDKWHDYTRRQCHDCNHIRPDPKDENA